MLHPIDALYSLDAVHPIDSLLPLEGSVSELKLLYQSVKKISFEFAAFFITYLLSEKGRQFEN